jgi:hypothetical protein
VKSKIIHLNTNRMNAITQILWQIRSIFGLANSARYTANSIKRERDRSKQQKEQKQRIEEQQKQQ